MIKEAIEKIIREEVRVDIYEDLYGVDRASEAIMCVIEEYVSNLLQATRQQRTQAEIEESWRLNPDRMGGQFTDQEIIESTTWR